jgi:hypothetical protein
MDHTFRQQEESDNHQTPGREFDAGPLDGIHLEQMNLAGGPQAGNPAIAGVYGEGSTRPSVSRRDFPPIKVIGRGTEKGGRAKIGWKGKAGWKDFKARSENSLVQMDASTRQQLRDREEQVTRYHDEMSSRYGSGAYWSSPPKLRSSAELRPLRANNRDLHRQVQYYLKRFHAAEDWPRYQAALKHSAYIDAAARMASVNPNDFNEVRSFEHAVVQHKLERQVKRAKQAHAVKELMFPSNSRPLW